MIARFHTPALSPPPPWLVELLAGFVYWAAFLLVLEPGNVMRAHHAGRDLTLDHEVLRITAASCLGAAVTPAALWLSRRFFPAKRPWHLPALTVAMAGLSVGLILVSCVLAAWMFEHDWLPGIDDITGMLAGNALLLLFALMAFCGLEFAMRPAVANPALPGFIGHVMVKARGRQFPLSLDTVDWIEAQGNYLAFHAGGATHLVRGTLSAFESKLDPRRFMRIHRGHVVALDRIASVDSFDNGDGTARLRDGTELKISRNYRKALMGLWQ